MKKAKFSVLVIFIFWGIIIGSYFVDSWIYEEIAIWIFISPLIVVASCLICKLKNKIIEYFNK